MTAAPARRKPAIVAGGWVGRAAVGAVLGLIRALPPGTQRRIARGVARLVWFLGLRRAVALDNLAHAFPHKTEAERRGIAKRAYEQLATAALESVTSDLLTDADVRSLVIEPEWKGLDTLLAQRKPVLVASAHFGSWELFAELMTRRGIALSAVVRPLVGAFNAWVVRNRQLAGLELILQRGALGGMLKALARGRVVVQLIDQVLPAKDGVFVPFFGRLVSATPAMSMAALRSKAPVYVVLAARDGAKLRMFVEGPIPVPDTGDRRADLTAHTAAMTAVIEAKIREYPEQWLWLHRRWKVKPPERPSG